jgi:hypothetical protein
MAQEPKKKMEQEPKKGYVRGEMGGLYKKKDYDAWQAQASKNLQKAMAPVSPKEKAAMQKDVLKKQVQLQAEMKRLNPPAKKK